MILNRQIKLASVVLLLAGSVTISNAAETTWGGNINAFGLGVFVAGDTGWSFANSDKIRWRASLAGFDTDDFDEKEFSDSNFSGQLESSGVQLGLDFYPFQNQFFISGGLLSFERDFDLDIVPEDNYEIGNQQVLTSDNIDLNVKLDHKSVAPYLSLGLGNKHAKNSGLAIFAEIGVMFPTDDPTAVLTLTGNNGLVSADDITLERKELEDDLGDVQLIATFGIGYHF